ncbi:ORF37 [Ranid herpesvirus 2]|uniref:ORF37 n=1 Tax=Ranid herpesvirus 2 TaxID=389214 RepID=Q14W69_9VIRU|nr:ORF37 [Ranid herpesvirus 2]ABG25645.1 ORF37 [Ranid herpesvirus 2]
MFFWKLVVLLACPLAALSETYISIFEEYWPKFNLYSSKIYVNRTRVAEFRGNGHGVSSESYSLSASESQVFNHGQPLEKQCKDVHKSFAEKNEGESAKVMQTMFECTCKTKCKENFDRAVVDRHLTFGNYPKQSRKIELLKICEYWRQNLDYDGGSAHYNSPENLIEVTHDYGLLDNKAYKCVAKAFFPYGHQLKWLIPEIAFQVGDELVLPNGDGTYTSALVVYVPRNHTIDILCVLEIGHDIVESVQHVYRDTEENEDACASKYKNAVIFLSVLCTVLLVGILSYIARRVYNWWRYRGEAEYRSANEL